MSIWLGSTSLRQLPGCFFRVVWTLPHCPHCPQRRAPNTAIVFSEAKTGYFCADIGIKAVSYPNRLGWGMHSPGS